MQPLIYVQKPEKSASQIMKIITDMLKEETHFEAVIKQQSFRAELLRKLINQIQK